MNTKLNLNVFGVLVGLMFFSLTSCEKDEDTALKVDPAKIVGNWTIESTEVTTTVNGEDYYDYRMNVVGESEEEAQFSTEFITMLYTKEGELSINEDGSYLSIFNEEEESGTWTIGEPNYHLYLNNNDDDKENFVTEVITLNSTTLEIQEQYIDITYSLDNTKTEEISIVTYKLVK